MVKGLMWQSIEWHRNNNQDRADTKEGNDKLIQYQGRKNVTDARIDMKKIKAMARVEWVVTVNQSSRSKQILCLLRTTDSRGDSHPIVSETEGVIEQLRTLNIGSPVWNELALRPPHMTGESRVEKQKNKRLLDRGQSEQDSMERVAWQNLRGATTGMEHC